MRSVRYSFLGMVAFLLAAGFAEAAGESVLELRQAYNTVVAEIDSVVRVMAVRDLEALDGKRLPDQSEDGLVPEGMAVVMIFWADDEAQVWVNDFLVGETRLTPVEVEVPSIYLQAQNRIRARCWDTDFVESGFMCGLYLRDQAGGLHPIVVSDGQWEAAEGRAMAITYAHPLPDIPGAEPIWATKVFGVVELSTTFEGQAVHKAQAGHVGGMQQKTQKRKMDYHRFLQHLVVLQGKRAELKTMLEAQTGEFAFPVYAGEREGSPGLTLGKAGPLKEAVSKPLAEQTQTWAKALPEKQQQLIYPESRALKGEMAATPGSDVEVATGGVSGQRQLAYQQPEERGAAPPGARRGKQGAGEDRQGGKGQKGSGSESVEAGSVGGGGGFGRATRWGLLIPTLILGLYVGYVVLNWDALISG